MVLPDRSRVSTSLLSLRGLPEGLQKKGLLIDFQFVLTKSQSITKNLFNK